MMKKNYLQPRADALLLTPQQLICGSPYDATDGGFGEKLDFDISDFDPGFVF